MLRIVVSSSADAAKSYFSDALSKSDYYLSDQELPGRWNGLAAERLGLSGEVKKEEFYALADNRHPLKGCAITPGGKKDNRRVGYDINFHCPKSVSILHALGMNDGILPAFEESVKETMQDMEKDMQTRIRKGGQYDDRTTGNMVWASFTHQTARPTKDAPPDPHLHAHCFTFNMTYDSQEERFKAGQFVRLKKDGMYYQAIFHKRLADRLQDLGYSIKKTKDAFEVLEVSEKAIHQFSKRTNHIGQVAKEQGITNAQELDALGARTRASKVKGLSMLDLQQSWKFQLGAQNILDSRKGILKMPYSVEQCKDHALQQCFERKSVVANRAIIQEAIRHSIGSRPVSIKDIQDKIETDQRIVRLEQNGQWDCTTKEVLSEEHEMVSLAIKGQGMAKPLAMAPLSRFDNSQLSREQRETINHIMLNRNSITLVQGKAGTGKTTMMSEAVAAIEKRGNKVFAFAPTAEASRGVLRAEGFKEADTVAMLLTDKELHEQLKDQVIWIDEAGLIGSRDMVKVLRLADEQNCRLILTGDDRQHRAVSRGDAFRLLHEVAGLPTAGTKTIYRQKQEEYRSAVSDLAEGKTASGFQKLEKMGAIQELESDQILDKLKGDYIAKVKANKLALIISPTHKEREKVNDVVRDELRGLKKIKGKDRDYYKIQSLNWTQADKKDLQNYKRGMVVQAHRNINKELARGSKAHVEKIEEGKVWIRNQQGQKLVLPIHQAERFDVCQRKSLKLAKGDMIRMTKNGYDENSSRLDNGTVLQVAGFTRQGQIRAHTVSIGSRLNSKEFLIGKYHGNLDYAYCQTSYASQGKTVDHVLIHQPAGTFAATNQEQFYVSVSRGREGVMIYTDDKEMLRITAEESSQRKSAVELQMYDEHVMNKRPDFPSKTQKNVAEAKPSYSSPEKNKSYGQDLTL